MHTAACAKKISPQHLIPLPWDKKSGRGVAAEPTISMAERRRRADEALKRFG